MRVVKRDGALQPLKMNKIQRALLMAFQGVAVQPDVMPLVHRVMDKVRREVEPVPIERVSEACEQVLLESGHYEIGKRWIRYKEERDRIRAQRLAPDSKAISDYIHIGKYARSIEKQNGLYRRELFPETVARDEEMHIRRWPELEAEIRAAFSFVYQKFGMPSMRSMQFGGAAIEKHNERLYNCSFMHISEWRRFQEAFFLLLCGAGVGYSVQRQHVECLSSLKHIDATIVCHYEVVDTIEGWADALGALLESYYGEVNCYVEFNYSSIRAEGLVLRTSGGKAPGHLPLKRCLERVRVLLDRAQGRQLRPIECHDILCHAAEAVLAGGIRRSSLISLFSLDDAEMIYAKAHENFRPASGNDPGHNAQREMANNSAALLRGHVDRRDFERLVEVAQSGYGDPGFYWTNNLDYGPNPCGEIGMWPVIGYCNDCQGYGNPDLHYCEHCSSRNVGYRSGVSFCNLTEVNCAAAESADALYAAIKAMAFIGTLQAAYTRFDYLGTVTEEIVRREALLGVGLCGIMDNRELVLQAEVLSEGARVAVAENQRVAKLIGIRPAARVTTIKPSGTSALELGGIGSGIHPRWSRRYIHRVTANRAENVAAFFKAMNPHMVEEKPNGDWSLMFPIQAPDSAVTVKEMPALEFLECVVTVYEHWICGGTALPDSAPGLTHNVSCTVTVRDGELEDVLDYIWREQDRIGAMTFVPYLIDRKFRYAPRQAIVSNQDEALWNYLIENYVPIDWALFEEVSDGTSFVLAPACAGGICEIG